MAEFRRDLISGKWVIIATERAKRPEDFTNEKRVETKPDSGPCIFCPGQEGSTPGELLAYGDKDRSPNSSGWKVRVFPNKFPALQPGSKFAITNREIYKVAEAVGFHEIIVSADHNKPPALMTDSELEMVLRAYQERFLVYCANDLIKYVLIIYNHGPEAGASIQHPHSQLFAIPIISNDLQLELDNTSKFFGQRGICPFCKIIENEVGPARGRRVIFQNDSFIALAPFAARSPFEVWILPRRHNPFFQIVDYQERLQLSECLRVVLKKFYQGLNNPPFNYYIQSAPCDGGDYNYYHWHLEILPRLTKHAGFEYGTGTIINVVDPDQAAAFLREVKID
jgi:UDPglucose--hexose-1-phosphate uridylyltransferase